MKGCLAPSEIPGIIESEYTIFGKIAEELIYMDFCTKYTIIGAEVFRDDNNPAAYLLFLATNNPQFTEAKQKLFYAQLNSEKLSGKTLNRIPDFIVHKTAEKAFYEIKPMSKSGLADGALKVGVLKAVYPTFGLPYKAGNVFTPKDHVLAQAGKALKIILKAERVDDGLICYQICLESEGVLETVTVAMLMRLVVQEFNKQKGNKTYKPVELIPVFQRNPRFHDIARLFGITLAAAATALAWKYFWKAVAVRFAVRGSAALALSVADGPLPVGELISLGIAVWTIVDIVRLHDQLWKDAADIKAKEA